MHRRVPEPSDCGQMRARRVALVPIKAVPRVLLVKLLHLSVPCHLREDRRGGDRGASAVPLHDMALWNEEIGKGKPVNQHEVGQRNEPAHGFTHGEERCLVNIQAVDIIRTCNGQRPGFGLRDDVVMKSSPRGGCQQLRITHARNRAVWIEYDGGGDNRTGKAAAANLIYASYPGKPEPPDRVLDRASCRWPRHRPRGRVGLGSPAAFTHSRGLATKFPQKVQLGSPNLCRPDDIDLVDDR